MADTLEMWLEDAEKTKFAGKSLAKSLYAENTIILLNGDLGAGKTTFLQGFGEGLGLGSDEVSSPTYALEQSYNLPDSRSFTHIDLYRLSEEQAEKFMQERDEDHAICCIEWANRLEKIEGNIIRIHLEENPEKEGRTLRISFEDASLPSSEQIASWREEVMLPPHICAHCDAVGNVAKKLADTLIQRGVVVRPEMVRTAGYLHDLLRFVDFKPEGRHEGSEEDDPAQLACWKEWKKQYQDLRHEPACAAFMREQGFHALAEIIAVHGVRLPDGLDRSTVEQMLVYYADKRCKVDEVVSIDERFADWKKRYGNSTDPVNSMEWYEEAKRVQTVLFPEGTLI